MTVSDHPAAAVVSVGIRGHADPAAIRTAMEALHRWLEGQNQFVAADAPRVLGYNSPFVPRAMRYWEAQIPVTRRKS